MAEFALGLTKTAVEGALSLIKSTAEEEAKLKEKVQNDLVFITGEFEMMQSFLHVANREHIGGNDELSLAWVRQLRNLAFDVEDCVEFVAHLDTKSPHWGWLRRVWHTLNCGASPLPLDVAVAEIMQLKARVEDVSQRNTRYILSRRNSNNNNNRPQQPVVTVVMTPVEQPQDATNYPSSTAFYPLRDAWKATGKWCSNMCNLQQELLIAREGENDDDLRVISVWGSSTGGGGGADLGTASIFRKAYRDPKICENFKIRAWVKLRHPFNHDEFVKSLLAQFSHQANTGVDFMKAKLMVERFLVVLEDVFTLEEWDVIRMYLPDSKNGSRIVVSTPQLGIALMCTGEPYQVSELRKFPGDNQFLCAFFKNKTQKGMGEFYRQLRHQGVISVWGPDDDDKSNLIDILHKGLINGWFKIFEGVSDAEEADHVGMLRKGIRNRMRKLVKVEFERHSWGDVEFERHSWGEVEFERHSWVDVPNPFDLKVFAQRLFLNFYSDDIQANEIMEVGRKGEAGLIERCCRFLFEEDCLVVINGLRSRDDWDQIERTFLSSKAAAKGCIIVITNEETLATHCVKDHKYQAFNVKDLKADTSISSLINKGSWHYGIRGMKGRLFYERRKDALEWTDKFKNVGGNNPNEGKDEEEFGVFTVSADVWGIHLQGILRHAYYVAFQQIKHRSWVDVPRKPFDLTDFSWRLLLDFYSDDPQAKEAIAVGLMEGTTIDPIEKCREFLRNKKCLVVINDLRSKEDWDSIRDTFLSDSEHIQSIIIVSSLFDRRINAYCSPKVLRLGTQQGFGDNYKKEYDCIFYTERSQKALRWTEKFKPVGRETELDELAINVCPVNGVISVWGIAGVGKSSVVRTVYYNEMLRSAGPAKTSSFGMSDPFEAFGLVDVPNPFNLTEFAWRLLLDLYSDDPQAKEIAAVSMVEEGRQVPIRECCKILQEIRCLVVIDGLRSTQDWDLIKATFLAEPIKSTIVVITIEERVAIHCVENDMLRVRNIRRLQANVALSLLEKIASTEQRVLLRTIVPKCGGLPKVIAATGEVCKSKLWKLWSLRDNFMGTLETDPEFHGLRPLFSWIQSYFDACSDSIKPCIFYLSIFDAEKNIRLRRLLWRWIAEGYCRDTSDGTTCEENWEKFVSELVKLSIIQESASSEVFCQINGFFHEYIISRPMEDNLVFALEEHCSLNSARAGQHLTIRSTWDRRDRIVYESIDFSRLRSLTVFGKWESFFICSKNANMRLLRVLDLEDATDVTNEDLEQIAKLLTRLKFLSLRCCREITRLPSSMGGLRQLQTLDIRGTSIVILPLFITQLQKLRYIRAGTVTSEAWDWEEGEEDRASSSAQAVTNVQPPAAATPKEVGTDTTALLLPPDWSCTPNLVSSLLSKLCRSGSNGGVKVPAGIQKLAVLHTLGVVNVNVTSSAKSLFEALKQQQLTQLRKLGVSGINKGNIKEFCEAISDHAHLTSLSVEVDKDGDLDDVSDNNIPELPKTIKRLKLYGRVNKLLVWIENLENLEKLKLDLTIKKPEELQALEFSPGYVGMGRLRIRPIQGGKLHFRGSGWTIAGVVEIQCSSVLDIIMLDDAQWFVEVLKVHFSRGSQSSLQISGLSNLEFLEEVWLKGYTDAHKQDMQRQINDMELRQNQKRPVWKLVQTRSS